MKIALQHVLLTVLLAIFAVAGIYAGTYWERPLAPGAGTCVETEIFAISTRLETPGSGSFIVYRNGVSGISYATIDAIEAWSRVADKIDLCLVSVEQGCPAGTAGKTYSATNKRTGATWTLPESTKACPNEPEATEQAIGLLKGVSDTERSPSKNTVEGFLLFSLYVLLGTFIYLLPTVLGLLRHHQSRWSICVINLFLGWTFIAWVICLAWSMGPVQGDGTPPPKPSA